MADPVDNIFKSDEQKDLELRKLRAEVARLEAQQKVDPPKSADELRKTKADADKAESEAALKKRESVTEPEKPAKPEKVTMPIPGTHPQGSGVGATQEVGLDVAEFYRRTASDAETARKNYVAEARQAVLDNQITANQALEKIKLQDKQLQDEITNRLRSRDQEITMRGQDASARVSQRGQDMDYEQSLAGQVASNNRALLPMVRAPGELEAFNGMMASVPGFQPIRGMAKPPFDPQQSVLAAAMAARQQMPAQYQLGQPSQPVNIPPYQVGG